MAEEHDDVLDLSPDGAGLNTVNKILDFLYANLSDDGIAALQGETPGQGAELTSLNQAMLRMGIHQWSPGTRKQIHEQLFADICVKCFRRTCDCPPQEGCACN